MGRIHGDEFGCASFAVRVNDFDLVVEVEVLDDGETAVAVGGCDG